MEYETLRESALRFDSEHQSAGMGVFILRGMAGWIDALPLLIHVTTEGRGTVCDQPQRPEIIHILADMIISCGGVR